MENVRLTVIQPDLHWESAEHNRRTIGRAMQDSVGKTDIFVLPEMFTTGFSMRPRDLAEKMNGKTVDWMKEASSTHKAVICGSLIIEENGKYYNRFLWVTPDGKIDHYDKRHLFGYAEEDDHFSGGEKQVVIHFKDWRIMPIICYDLRFPVWSRQSEEPYDLLICVANFPAARANAWKTLLQARAIENQCYVVGCNRVGKDGNDIQYQGDSMGIDFAGDTLLHMANNPQSGQFVISKKALNTFRAKYPFLQDRDNYRII